MQGQRTTPHTGHMEAATPWAAAREAAREAGDRAGGDAAPHPAHDVPLDAARGAVLVEGLVARIGIPSFDAAAMDGYAVAGEAPWRVLGRALAGRDCPVDALAPGEAVEIATGARTPRGTHSVLPFELAEVSGGVVTGETAPERHVRRSGEDTAPGDVVVSAGTPVTPALIGLAASLGHDTLRVRCPRVAALMTGDELSHQGIPRAGTVRDAIGPMLPGLVAWAGGTLWEAAYVDDSFAGMVAAVRGAGSRTGAEVVVVCGASSKGPADHLRGALVELGAANLIDGVACRPGHPQLLSLLPGGPIVVGLPGNPHAALAAAMTLLDPVLAGLTGRLGASAALRWLPVSGEVQAHRTDTRLVPVRDAGDHAVPVGHGGSATLRGAAAADALAVIPPDWAGEDAEMLPLPV